MGSAKEDLAVIVRADTSGLASDLNRAGSMVKQFASDAARNSSKADFADNSAAFKKSARAAGEAKSSYLGAASGLASFAGKAAIAGGALLAVEAGFSGLAGAIGLVKDSVRLAADVEQTTIAFEVMLGSVDKTTTALGELRKFAAETPFSNTEVTASARQLLAYGVAADQLIPTLKVLGTISAATSSPLKDMAYRYGTLVTQGRAYAQDLHQFTNAGVAINPGLAKALGVTEAELHKLTEDGRVGINEVQAALADLANTKYSGLLERQSRSLKGSWEQLGDAWDRAKLKLGQVIVEEVGLKDGAKSLEAFGAKIESVIGGPGVRGAIHFLGDLAKGGAQVGYEFAKAGGQIATISFEGMASASPQVAELAKNTREFVAGIQNFRFDKRKVAEFGISLFQAIAHPIAWAVDWVEVEGKGYYDAFKRNFIDPVDKWASRLDSAWQTIKKIGAVLDEERPQIPAVAAIKRAQNRDDRDFLREAGIAAPIIGNRDFSLLPMAADVVKATMDAPYFKQPTAAEPAESALWRYKHLSRLIDDARFLSEVSGFKQFQPHLDQLRGLRAEYLAPFSADVGRDFAGLDAQFKAGALPPIRPDWRPPPPPEPVLNNRDTLKKRAEQFGTTLLASMDAADMKGAFGKVYESIEKGTASAYAVGNPLGLAAALGPLGGLAPAALAGKGEDGLRPFAGTPPHLVELANKLNEQFGGAGLMTRLGDLDKLRDLNLVGPDVYAKGRNNAIRETADRLGLGGETRLPGAALVGSAEDARLLAQFRSGGTGRQSAEDLLRMILDEMRKNTRGAAAIEDALRAAVGGVVNVTP